MTRAVKQRGSPADSGRRHALRLAAVIAATAAVGFAGRAGLVPQTTKAALQSLTAVAARSGNRAVVGWRLRSWTRVALPGITLYVEPGVRERDVRIAASALRLDAPKVASDFGIAGHAPWPVVVVTRTAMAAALRVPAAAAPLGYYQGGVIWLLAPSAFLPLQRREAGLYRRQGPVVHELTHEADAVVSGGHVPRWLDEGLAQYEEWRLTGYVWIQPGNAFTHRTYTWPELTVGNFGGLPNQAMAYRQALAAAAAVCRTRAGACVQLLRLLRAGGRISEAIRTVGGSALLVRLQGGACWVAGTGPAPLRPAGPPP